MIINSNPGGFQISERGALHTFHDSVDFGSGRECHSRPALRAQHRCSQSGELSSLPIEKRPHIQTNQLLQENMPPGHTMESLAEYIRQCKQSYTMKGLTIRAEQDKGGNKRQSLRGNKEKLKKK